MSLEQHRAQNSIHKFFHLIQLERATNLKVNNQSWCTPTGKRRRKKVKLLRRISLVLGILGQAALEVTLSLPNLIRWRDTIKNKVNRTIKLLMMALRLSKKEIATKAPLERKLTIQRTGRRPMQNYR